MVTCFECSIYRKLEVEAVHAKLYEFVVDCVHFGLTSHFLNFKAWVFKNPAVYTKSHPVGLLEWFIGQEELHINVEFDLDCAVV